MFSTEKKKCRALSEEKKEKRRMRSRKKAHSYVIFFSKMIFWKALSQHSSEPLKYIYHLFIHRAQDVCRRKK